MSTFDIIIIIIAIASFIIGMFKGLIKELSGFLGYVIGVYGAVKFSSYTESVITEHFPDLQGVGVISFCITLALIVVGVHFLSAVINRAVGMTLLSLPNKLLGGLFAVAKNLFFVSCFISIVNYFVGDVINLFGEDESSRSIFYSYIKDLAQYFYPYLDFGIQQAQEALV